MGDDEYYYSEYYSESSASQERGRRSRKRSAKAVRSGQTRQVGHVTVEMDRGSDKVAAMLAALETTEAELDTSHLEPCAMPMALEFSDVRYSVDLGGGASKEILHGVSGAVYPGQVLAILGPSGAGKTTLLKVLAQRLVTGKSSGSVTVNGAPIDDKAKRSIGYVLQEDHLLTELTVQETLEFAALIRLPREMPKAEKLARVKRVIKAFGLEHASKTKIGGVNFGGFTPGVSGGEKKRTSIANEMLFDPSLLFLDEPTSGLDSSTALKILKELRVLASSGRTVVATIHQPSSQIFSAFDLVALMAGGELAYFGPAKRVVEYFTSIGLRPPAHFNPADFMLEVVSSPIVADDYNFGEEFAKQMVKYRPERPTELPNAPVAAPGTTPRQPGSRKFEASFLTQVQLLTLRAFRQERGDIFTKLKTFQYAAITIITSVLWYNIAYNASTINDRVGLMFFILLYLSFESLFHTLIMFPAERPVFSKERQAGAYTTLAYVIGKSLADIPVSLTFPTVIASVVYWMTGLRPDFFAFLTYLIILWVQVMSAQSLGLLIGAVMTLKKALVTVGVVLLGMVLTAGFYVSTDSLGSWIRWIRYVSVFLYGFQAMLLNEIKGEAYPCFTSDDIPYSECPVTESQIRDFYGIDMSIASNIFISLAIALVGRFAAYYGLVLNQRAMAV